MFLGKTECKTEFGKRYRLDISVNLNNRVCINTDIVFDIFIPIKNILSNR